ncbi:MAG: hypothetical protein ABH883_04710 [Candidatus Omnitrophota bacterium]
MAINDVNLNDKEVNIVKALVEEETNRARCYSDGEQGAITQYLDTLNLIVNKLNTM